MKNNIVKFLDTPIEYLGLSTTITNALKRRNVYSIVDLLDVENEYGLENLRKIGSKSLSSIKEKLLEYKRKMFNISDCVVKQLNK